MGDEEFERGLVLIFEPRYMRVVHSRISEVGKDLGYIVEKVAVRSVVPKFSLVKIQGFGQMLCNLE